MAATCAAFSGPAAQEWAINVKNTFINFDPTTIAPLVRRSRSNSCPPRSRTVTNAEDADWEAATQELCHAMALRPFDAVAKEAATARGTKVSQRSGKSAAAGKAEAGLDTISEVSTTSGGSPRTDSSPCSTVTSPNGANSQETLQLWTSVSSRKKPKQRLANQSLVPREERPAPVSRVMPSTSSATTAPATPVSAAATPSSSTSTKPKPASGSRDEASQARKYDGKGKGLSHFQRIEVGIEDDRDFRVVQRLIGPKGKHMQDITTAAKGAKVWIIGRGSRSWEDDVGPLVVCVGATSRSTLDTAITLINVLLTKVRDEYQKFYG